MVVASMESHNSVRDADGVEGGSGSGNAQTPHTIDRRKGQRLSRKRDRTRICIRGAQETWSTLHRTSCAVPIHVLVCYVYCCVQYADSKKPS